MADSKVSGLTSATTLVAPDLFLVITNATGTPVSKKISLKGFLANLNANTVIAAATATLNANTSIAGTLDVNTSANTSFDARIRTSADPAAFFTDAGNNCIGIGTSLPQTKLDIASNKMRLRTPITPSNSNAVTQGVQTGTIMWDTNYIYLVVNGTTIKRAPLSSF